MIINYFLIGLFITIVIFTRDYLKGGFKGIDLWEILINLLIWIVFYPICVLIVLKPLLESIKLKG